MATLIKYTAFEPLVTGPLLWVLTRGSADLRAHVLRPLASLPFNVETSVVVKTLKVLFVFGLLRKINSWLNTFAKNNWTLSTGGKAWDYPNEVAAITGGSGGIGSEVALRLAKTGMKVVIMDPSPPPAKLKSFRNIYHFECDITNPDNVKEVAAKIKSEVGAPTILFNNAGIGKTFTILDVPDAFLDKIFKINLISHWYTTRAFLPDMIAGKKGHIVSTASMASFVNVAGMVDYCVTKAGVMSFHEGLNQELKYRYDAPFIKTTIIHPYWVQTNLIKDWTESSLRKLREPLLKPERVADAITKAILSGQSQQVCLPEYMGIAASTRAFAWWLQEIARDTTKRVTQNPSS